MMLLAIVLVLLGLRWLDLAPRPLEGTRFYLAQLGQLIRSEKFWRWQFAPWLVLLAPVVALRLVDWKLPWFLHLLLAIGVLWFALGPRELANDLRAWLAARRRGDETEAEYRARTIWGESRADALGRLFVESHERLFGVLIWFFLLGPAGGLLYRLGRKLAQHWPGDSAHARAMHAALAFAPARITAALFAAAGSADDVIAQWRRRSERAGDWVERTWRWLSEIAAASIDVEEEGGAPAVPATLEESAQEFLHLEYRALLILLALFAIFTVGSWFG